VLDRPLDRSLNPVDVVGAERRSGSIGLIPLDNDHRIKASKYDHLTPSWSKGQLKVTSDEWPERVGKDVFDTTRQA